MFFFFFLNTFSSVKTNDTISLHKNVVLDQDVCAWKI